MNVVTKSGGNTLKGSGAYELQPMGWNGNNVPTPVFYVIALAFVWTSIVAAITMWLSNVSPARITASASIERANARTALSPPVPSPPC